MISERAQRQTIVLYGPSGGGKTSLAATAPRPIFLDSNQGMLSIIGRPGLTHVKGVDVHNMQDLDRAYAKCTGTDPKRRWDKMYDSIVFDHFDDIQAIVLEELGDKAVAKDDRRDQDETQQREWGIMGNRMRRYIRKFKRVPMIKVLICGEMEDRETGRMRPNLQGALKNQLQYFTDHVMYLGIGKKGKRFIGLDPTDDYYAKTRAWWLPVEQRRIDVPFADTKFLTNLLGLFAAGPSKPTTSGRG